MLLALAALTLALLPALVAGCAETPTENIVAPAATGSIQWAGNGSENNCEAGGSLHWILTTGGNVALTEGTLTVNFADGSSGSFTGYFQGQGKGAMHFDSVGTSAVVSASATYTASGTVGNQVLTISHSTCNETTTTTQTTTTQSSTTTSSSTTSSTSTTLGGVTTTIDVPTTSSSTSTSSTSSSTTSTTASPTTSTSGATTTVSVTSTTVREVTTTVSAPTTTVPGPTTTVPGPTTTSVAQTTTSSTPNVTGGETTVPSNVTSTTLGTGGSTPTPSGIDTGAGGTAGSNTTLWALVALLAALAVGLGGSAVRMGVKQRSARKR